MSDPNHPPGAPTVTRLTDHSTCVRCRTATQAGRCQRCDGFRAELLAEFQRHEAAVGAIVMRGADLDLVMEVQAEACGLDPSERAAVQGFIEEQARRG